MKSINTVTPINPADDNEQNDKTTARVEEYGKLLRDDEETKVIDERKLKKQ